MATIPSSLGRSVMAESKVSEDMYKKFVDDLFQFPKSITPEQGRLLHAIIGIAGEAGELLDTLKRHVMYKEELDVSNIKEEAGDILFYLEALLNTFNWTLDEVRDENIQKLTKRYPSGFSYEDALRKRDKDEHITTS